jgi:hypothetical protein
VQLAVELPTVVQLPYESRPVPPPDSTEALLLSQFVVRRIKNKASIFLTGQLYQGACHINENIHQRPFDVPPRTIVKVESAFGGEMRSVSLAIALLFSLIPAATPLHAATVDQATFFGFGDGIGKGMSVDAANGLKSILAGEDFNYGVPVRLLNHMAKKEDMSKQSQWEVFGSLPSPTWRQTPFVSYPLSLSQSVFLRSGAPLINTSCFACHAGNVANQIVAGLGNMNVDAVSLKSQLVELTNKFDSPLGKLELAVLLTPTEMHLLKGYVDYIKSVVLPSLQPTGRGDIHGPWIIWRLIARIIDPATGFDFYSPETKAPLESLLDNYSLPPVRPNPWWRLKYKKRAFWTKDIITHSYPTFALNLMDPAPNDTDTFAARLQRSKLQIAFAEQTNPPTYPWLNTIDKAKAAEGWSYFSGTKPLSDGSYLRCTTCHGHYAQDGKLISFPDLDPIDIRILNTDPTYATILHDDLGPLYERFNLSPFALKGNDAPRQPPLIGYAPPPLVGIWAAAPYFHNGSIPTIYDVLNSTQRPQFWTKTLDLAAYDQSHVGVSALDLTPAQYNNYKEAAADSNNALSEESLTFRGIYDTTQVGKSNSGHPFGDRMSDTERSKVLEYLKLL